MRRFPPSRIVCRTEETVETLYLLGEQDRIVGVSGYAVRPPEARREKPRVSAFISADIPKILALEPDLVFTFSDLQAEIAAALIRVVGALVHAADKADTLAKGYEPRLSEAETQARGLPRPKVYFEEWDDPLISGIGWVSELIEIAGGEDVFAALRTRKSAKDRIVAPEDVVAAAPDMILASWCGKKVQPEKIRRRAGWEAVPAVRTGRIVEIKSPLILQPGPAALTDGLDALKATISGAASASPSVC